MRQLKELETARKMAEDQKMRQQEGIKGLQACCSRKLEHTTKGETTARTETTPKASNRPSNLKL